MSENVLVKYGLRSSSGSGFAERLGRDREEVADPADEFACYSVLRGSRDRAIHLQLFKADGRVFAPAYTYISRLEYDPGGTITLYTSEHTIAISGCNLNKIANGHIGLFDALSRHRVILIREREQRIGRQPREEETVVEKITW